MKILLNVISLFSLVAIAVKGHGKDGMGEKLGFKGFGKEGKGKKDKKEIITVPVYLPASTSTTPPPPPPITSISPPMVSCPPEYTLHGRICEREVLAMATHVCSRGGELIGETCYIRRPADRECPPNYSLYGTSCQQLVEQAPVKVCHNGYENMESHCQKTEPAPIISVCPRGENQNGSCIIEHTQSVKIHSDCPAEFQEEAGECCKIETYDCTDPGVKPLGCSYDDPTCATPPRHLHKKSNSDGKKGASTVTVTAIGSPPVHQPVPYPVPHLIPNPVAPFNTVPSEPTMPVTLTSYVPEERTQAVVVISKTCQRKIIRPMNRTPYCESGKMRGNICFELEVLRPEQKCLGDPNKTAEDCTRTYTAPHTLQCPPPFRLTSSKCISTVTTETTPTCRDGTKLEGDFCVHTVAATRSCRVGSLTADGFCRHIDTAPPTVREVFSCTGSACVEPPNVHHQPPPPQHYVTTTVVSSGKKGKKLKYY